MRNESAKKSSSKAKTPPGTYDSPGQPTKYRPEYCDEIITLRGDKGYCDEEVAKEWNVSVTTLHNWRATHPEFLKASTRAAECHYAFLYKIGREKLVTVGNEQFNDRPWWRLLQLTGYASEKRRISIANNKGQIPSKMTDAAKIYLQRMHAGLMTAEEASECIEAMSKGNLLEENAALREKTEDNYLQAIEQIRAPLLQEVAKSKEQTEGLVKLINELREENKKLKGEANESGSS